MVRSLNKGLTINKRELIEALANLTDEQEIRVAVGQDEEQTFSAPLGSVDSYDDGRFIVLMPDMNECWEPSPN